MQQEKIFHILKPLAKKEKVKFDFFLWERENSSLAFENMKLSAHSFSEDQNFCIRLIRDTKAGCSYTKNLSEEKINECFNQALLSLAASERDEEGPLPPPETFPPLFDSCIKEELSLEEKINLVKGMDKAAHNKSENLQNSKNSLSESKSNLLFGNSENAGGNYSTAYIAAFSYSLVKGKRQAGQGLASRISRSYKDITKSLGEESAQKALQKANFDIPETKTYPVVFNGIWASPVLLDLLLYHLNGKNIYENMSLLKEDSLGQKKFSQHVTLVDDPFALWGLGVYPFDGEGYASQKTVLVEKGIIKNYLTNSFFSKKLNAPHTAKAQRLESGRLAITPTNGMMLSGSSSFEEMRDTFREVIEVDFLKGLAGYNSISGDFSIESEGFLWSQGEARPIGQFTVSGNIISLFADIIKTGKESFISRKGLKAPSFLVPELSVAGK